MHTSKHVARFIVLVLACVAVLLGAGCGSSRFDGDDHGTEKTGTLVAALQTTGADGATYRFVNGSSLFLNAVGPGTGGAGYPIDGTETTFTKQLGAGNYLLSLGFGPDYTTPHFVRTHPTEGTSIVEATWKDPQPLPFAITAGNTTNVTLHFDVPGLGSVTFSPGTLSVDLAVNNDIHAKPSAITLTATITPTSVSYDGGYSDGMAAIVAAGTTQHFTVVVSPKAGSSWMLDIESACIDVDVTTTSAGPGETAFDLRLELVEGGTARLCVRNDGPTSDSLLLSATTLGPAPVDQQSTLPATYTRYFLLTANIGDVFDGTTLNQGRLGQGVAMLAGNFIQQLYADGSGTQLSTLQGTITTGSVSATP